MIYVNVHGLEPWPIGRGIPVATTCVILTLLTERWQHHAVIGLVVARDWGHSDPPFEKHELPWPSVGVGNTGGWRPFGTGCQTALCKIRTEGCPTFRVPS